MSQKTEKPSEFVRVDAGRGAKATVSRVYAESVGMKILTDDATRPDGKPLSATYPEAKPSAEKKA